MSDSFFGKTATRAARPDPIVSEDGLSVRIPLTSGLWATVDSEDLERVLTRNWHASANGGQDKRYSARTRREVSNVDGVRKWESTYLQTFILGQAPAGMKVRALNGDALDCRKANLTFATMAEVARVHSVRAAGRRFESVRMGDGSLRVALTGCFADATRNLWVRLDAEDLGRVSQHRWRRGAGGIVRCQPHPNTTGGTLARFVMENSTGGAHGIRYTHLNHNQLDFRKANLQRSTVRDWIVSAKNKEAVA